MSAGATKQIVDAALANGFAWAAPAPGGAALRGDDYRKWLTGGFAGEMHYLSRNADVRADPRVRFDWLRSVLVLGIPYDAAARTDGRESGHLPALVSRYARGDDYHNLIEKRLKKLSAFCIEQCGAGHARYYVDTGPVLERDWAARSGIGFQGKNAMVIRPGAGSWFFLAVMLLDIELEPDETPAQDHCGSCRLCIDACPTGAIVEPYRVDSRRCVSYLTIELRGAIPAEHRSGIGHRIFGCDDCQDACPYNETSAPAFSPELSTRRDYEGLHAIDLIEITEDRFREIFRSSAIRRTKRSGIRRNALIVCANLKLAEAAGPATRCLADPDPVIRGTAAWALARLDGNAHRPAIQAALQSESDPGSRAEMEAALAVD